MHDNTEIVTTKWLLKAKKGNNRQMKYSENERKHRVMCSNCDKVIFQYRK